MRNLPFFDVIFAYPLVCYCQVSKMKKFKSRKTSFKRKTTMFIILMTLSFSFFLSYFSAMIPESKLVSLLLETNLGNEQTKMSTKSKMLDFLLDTTIGRGEYQLKESKQEYTIDPKPEENSTSPLIYIYNTHQGEEYKGGTLSSVDKVPTVMLASYYLREKLAKEGIASIVETTNINEILRTQGWNYTSSYEASKILIKNAMEKYHTLKAYIDIHRDSVEKSISTLDYQNKKYARILLVVGTDYEGYSTNEEYASRISNLMNQQVPEISRGILKKGGAKVNGIYNQNLSNHMLLIEIGSEYNQIEEVKNTLDVLATVLKRGISND